MRDGDTVDGPIPTPMRPTQMGRTDAAAWNAPQTSLPKLATIAAVVAVIYFAKAVVLPLAIAMLLTFALTPLVTRLRKVGLPNIASVLIAVAIAFTALGLFVLVVVSQLGTLAQNLPQFQANIITKVENLREAGSEVGVIAKLTDMITAINDEITAAVPAPPDATAVPGIEAPTTENPMPVEVVSDQSPFATLTDLVLPLISPIATTGLVIVVVIFMLLEREDLRDRFIRLVGSNDLHRTTQVLQEAGGRVAQYLLVQLLVNLIYAIPIGIGLWFIGVPNAILWGLLTLVLRFVPYIGTVLAAAFPLFLAFAVSPDWSAVLWTIALFATVELITSNVIEPWLYGSRTGVSPLAIIVSAIFWTWVWGPLGLVMSTPLTVCLVVMGRHIPQFAVFDIMFGDQPVLAPHARLYQRLLVGDAIEATFRAEESLETLYLGEYYRDVGIPALLIAQNDLARGVLTPDQQQRLAGVAQAMVADLSEVVTEELLEFQTALADDADAEPQPQPLPANLPANLIDNAQMDGAGYRVICVGGRSDLDDVSAAMLAQTMQAEGATAQHRPHTDLAPSRFRAMEIADNDCIVISFLDPEPSRASFLHIRRIKAAAPHLRVGVVIWNMPGGNDAPTANGTMVEVSETSLQQARDIGADFAVTSFDDVLKATFRADAPLPIVVTPKRAIRPRKARPVELAIVAG